MNKKINLVSANMGYGHQRAAYPLLDLAGDEIITVNNYQGIPEWEKKQWEDNLASYEKISRLKKVPIIGGLVFSVMDYFQRIKPFYPYRNLSRPTAQQLYFFRQIKKGLGADLMLRLAKNDLPLVTSFFVAMYMAQEHSYSNKVYSIVCDADISRAWAPIFPKKSSAMFFAPNQRVKERLTMYGVKAENVFVTGFPLPKENVGAKKEILLQDLSRRLVALDRSGIYREKEKPLLKKILPRSLDDNKSKDPLCITYAVGGAGAQKEIGVEIVNSLIDKIKRGDLRLNLVAGVRDEVKEYFEEALNSLGLAKNLGVKIIYDKDKINYFKKFNKALSTTDILWTKPSELSFYASLGLPIIMSETIGSQEDFNRAWLLEIGAGIDSLNPKYTNEWLEDMLESGRLAKAAINGYLNGESQGAYNIETIITKNK